MCINYPTASRVLEAQRSGRTLHKAMGKSKEALVVDLCFKHSNCDNEIAAIRKNHQQLYMDILGAPIVLCEQVAGIKAPDKNHHWPLFHYGTVLPKLHGFHILSNTEELLRLSKQAGILVPLTPFPPIRPGMWTSTKLQDEFGTNSELALLWLKEADDKKQVFYLDSDPEHKQPIPLVEWVQSGVHSCLALHEAPEAIRRFTFFHPLLLRSSKIKKMTLQIYKNCTKCRFF